MVKFFYQKPLWVNLLIILALAALLIFALFQSLRFFTHHGSYLKVPDVSQKTMAEASAMLKAKGFEIHIMDSVYNDTLAPLTVVKQFPEPDATVKVNRVVYLTINRAVPPVIEMPNLVGMSFRNAELELKARGLKLGDTSYKPDIAKNAVLEQLSNKFAIKPGTKITMGTVISLVLGAGVGTEYIVVPDLFGMNLEEATALLEAHGLMLGSVIPDGDIQDHSAAFIFWQQPDRVNPDGSINRIRQGQMIDVRITSVRPERKFTEAAPGISGTGSSEY